MHKSKASAETSRKVDIYTCTCTLYKHYILCSDHYLNKSAGVDTDEALRTMALLRQRLAQGAADVETSVSDQCMNSTSVHAYGCEATSQHICCKVPCVSMSLYTPCCGLYITCTYM